MLDFRAFVDTPIDRMLVPGVFLAKIWTRCGVLRIKRPQRHQSIHMVYLDSRECFVVSKHVAALVLRCV